MKSMLKQAAAYSLAVAVIASCSTLCNAAEVKVVDPLAKGLDGWNLKGSPERSHWTMGYATMNPENPRELIVATSGDGSAQLVNAQGHGVDIYSKEKFGDCTIELELMVPQGSNSGIYVMGEYEIQVLDSYGREKVGPGDIGGLYGAQAPSKNASKAPGQWQKFVIEFKAPRFENGQKIANARFVKVTLNGQVIHEDVEMQGPTPGGVTHQEAATGPLMFQGNHGPVAYRNIKITTPAE